ncbi:hypothetical protein ACA350_01945 [Orientia tsutsugamushi]|uniref:hypothetical protein n=1 Tax=Orientia tsutsugamushi TaxID=784 RepID=UPI0035291385
MGYNSITKKCLLIDVFINESLLDTTPAEKYIVQKLFASTMKDSDFYLNKEILLVIKEALLQSIERTLKDDFLDNSPLPLDIVEEL